MNKKSSQRSDSGQEEEQEPSVPPPYNLRNRNNINYSDDIDKHEHREKMWPVTCGEKKGMMDIQKLREGEECIECEGLMLTPPAFEKFAGKGSSRKWKHSIYSDGKPLQHLFENVTPSTKGYKRLKISKTSKNNGEKPAHNFRRLDAQGAGESGESRAEATDDSENDDGIPSASKLRRTEEEKERNDSDHPEGKRNEELDEMENDGDDNNKDLCVPKDEEKRERDPEKKNSIKSEELQEMSKLMDGEEPVESETADVATNTSPQQEPVDEKIPELLSSWREPLEDNARIEETEGDAAVAEGNELINENLGASAELVVSSNGDGIDEEKDAVLEMRSPQHAEMTSSPLVKDQTSDPMCLSVAPANLLLPFVNKEINEKDADEAKPDRDEAELESIRVSDCRNVSEKMEDGASDGSDVDAMDVDQLKKKKLKMQLKVLKLQEEYYTLKLNNLK